VSDCVANDVDHVLVDDRIADFLALVSTFAEGRHTEHPKVLGRDRLALLERCDEFVHTPLAVPRRFPDHAQPHCAAEYPEQLGATHQ
jgi:hypothetical protein